MKIAIVLAMLAALVLVGCEEKGEAPEGMPKKPVAEAQPEVPVPEAPHAGQALMAASCATCHELDKVTSAKMSKEDWESQVDMCMSMDGAPEALSEEDNAKLVDYLATNHGE